MTEFVPLVANSNRGYDQTLMPETNSRYAIRGGKEGKKRLDVLARVLLPSTMQLLDGVGAMRRMKCLDMGCGGGHGALLMAGVVGPEGRVIGTDRDAEILALAKEDAEAATAANVTFQQLHACMCLWHTWRGQIDGPTYDGANLRRIDH